MTGFPSPTTAGTAGIFTVTALDSLGDTASTYTGTVKFSSSDNAATVPANYTFLGSDSGMHTFSGTLNTAGVSESIAATDVSNTSLTGSQTGITTQAGKVPAYLLSYSGASQITVMGMPFGAGIAAKVTDAGHNGMAGVTVTFTSPAPGAGAMFSSLTAVTDASGVAAVTATANAVTGSYSVIATVNSLTAAFALTNTTRCDVNIDGLTTAADVQSIVNQGLGSAPPSSDLNGDHVVNVVDMQIVVNAVFQWGCAAS